MPTPTLTPTEIAILSIESMWWRYAGVKEQAIRERTGMSAEAYYLKLGRLIDTEAALAHDPITVKRVREVRASRQRSRSARRLGMAG